MPYGKILIIDEDAPLRRLISDHLAKEGMECITLSRVDGIALYEAGKATLIILSRTLAGDAPEATISALRNGLNIPLIITSSFCDDIDPTIYLRAGADDVIKKPFDIAELALKTRSLVRRWEGNGHTDMPKQQRYKGLYVDVMTYTVSVDGREAALAPKELEMLYLLMSKPEYTFTKGELSSRVWGTVLADNRTITVHINRIKKKIGSYAQNIVSIRGVGYKFTHTE